MIHQKQSGAKLREETARTVFFHFGGECVSEAFFFIAALFTFFIKIREKIYICRRGGKYGGLLDAILGKAGKYA